MAARKLLAAAFCVLLVASLSACGEQVATRTKQSAAPAKASWVVLVDLSQSTLPFRRDYLDALGHVLRAVRPGDSLTILSIERSSVQNAQFLYQGTFPRYQFEPSPPPDTDNPLAIKDHKAQEQQRRAREQAQFNRAHNLTTEMRRLRDGMASKVLTSRARATDIFGSLLLAGNQFSATPGPHRLIMLSDGVVVDGEVDFPREPPTTSLIARIAHRQKREHRLPNLRGAELLVVGARLGGAARFAQLSRAWQLYINRYAGGHLQARFFMSRLSDGLFAAWLRSDTGHR
jgi:hypothetical protein